MLTPKGAAERAGVSRPTIVRALQDRQITAQKDNRGRWLITPEAVDEWSSRRAVPAAAVRVDSVHEQRIAALEVEVETLKTALHDRETALARAEGEAAGQAARMGDLARDRDAWRAQAEQLASGDGRPVITRRSGLLGRLLGR